MIHVSDSCNPNFHFTGAHYINADTSAFMQLLRSDLFERFPKLRLIIPHGGGAVPYHWGRYRGIALDMKRQEPAALMSGNLFFDRSEERRVGKECVRPCRSRWWPYH